MSEVDPERPVWRFFHGDWNVEPGLRDWVYWDKGGLTWAQARDLARRVFERHVGGDCPPCHVEAKAELARLDAAEPGTPFTGGIEGDDVLLLAEEGAVP